MTQVVVHMPLLFEALGSNPGTRKRKIAVKDSIGRSVRLAN
jgi:hypothetical protein